MSIRGALVRSIALLALLLGGCGEDSPDRTGADRTAPAEAKGSPSTGSATTGGPQERRSRDARSRKKRRSRSKSAEGRKARRPTRTGAPAAAPVKTRPWAATASLELVKSKGQVFTYRGPVAGSLPGQVTATLTVRGSNSSGSFVARLPGGTVEGNLQVVSKVGRGVVEYEGSATTVRGTLRYARLTPTELTVTGGSSPPGITLSIAGNLRY